MAQLHPTVSHNKEITMLKFGLVAAMMVAMATIGILSPFAEADAAPVGTTIVLACDRNANASATVALKADLFSAAFDTVNLSCGPDSVSGLKAERLKVTTGNAGAFSYSISLTNVNGSGGCVGGSTAPAKVTCDLTQGGPNVSLTVR
jgi:hypothetical protein